MSEQFSSNELKASYGIGMQMGQQLLGNPFEGLDLNAVVAGITDAFDNKASQVSEQELHAAFNAIHEQMQAAKEKDAEKFIAEGEAFLAENAQRDEVSVTESGLQYEVLNAGSGDKPTAASTVVTHYHGTLIDGTVFDSSYARGEPAEFPVGGVIKGWTEALQMMNVGTKWRLYVPHDLAYGSQGAGAAIKPYSTLIFDVELIEIKS